MTEDHDLGEDFYSAYSAGTLDPGLRLMVETQAALRPDVCRELRAADSVSGFFLETETPAPMSFRAVDRALDRIETLESNPEAGRKAANLATKMVDELIRLPQPLQEVALQTCVHGGWKYAGKGLRVLQLEVSPDVTTELLRIEPGCGAPRHTHDGAEYTLVVSGGFTDEYGSYGPGDVAMVGPEHTHKPVADEGEVCFALAVRDGGLKFEGLLGFVQKFFG